MYGISWYVWCNCEAHNSFDITHCTIPYTVSTVTLSPSAHTFAVKTSVSSPARKLPARSLSIMAAAKRGATDSPSAASESPFESSWKVSDCMVGRSGSRSNGPRPNLVQNCREFALPLPAVDQVAVPVTTHPSDVHGIGAFCADFKPGQVSEVVRITCTTYCCQLLHLYVHVTVNSFCGGVV